MSLVGINRTDENAPVGAAAPCCESEPDSSIEAAPYFRWKGILDRVVAAVLLIPGLPLIAFSIALIRLTSKGPGIYRQTRAGKGRRPFTMYKIRTMREDAEDGTGPRWTTEEDDRITPAGRFLRRTHLDEFPQLFNVLKGQMSLIGPRPERPEFVKLLSKEVPNYLDRLAVNPGITGLAQINLEADVTIECVHRKLVLDTEYVKHATVFFDFRILFCTLLYLVGHSAACAKRITGIKREVPRLSSPTPSGDDAARPKPETPPTLANLSLQIVRSDNGKNGSKNGSRPHAPMTAISPAEEAPSLKPR